MKRVGTEKLTCWLKSQRVLLVIIFFFLVVNFLDRPRLKTNFIAAKFLIYSKYINQFGYTSEINVEFKFTPI